MKKHLIMTLILIMGLCACGTKQQPAPTAAPTAEPTAVPTEAPAAVPDEKTEESVLPTEETAGGKTQTADKQALDVINALEAAGGERMMVSDAYIVLDTAGKSVWKVPLAGLEFEVPDFMQDAHGGIRAMQGHETIPGTGIVELDVIYLSMTEREYYDLAKKLADYADDTENIDETFGLSTRYLETAHEFGQRRYPLFTIIGIGDNRGVDEILAAERKYLEEYYTDAGIDPEAEPDNRIFTPIGSAEDYNFFYVQEPMEEERLARIAAYGEQYKAEYQSLFNAKNQIIPNFTFSRPIGIRDLVAEGTGLSFETLDIQGSTVKGEDIFKGHKATMLNIWATTSAACIRTPVFGVLVQP